MFIHKHRDVRQLKPTLLDTQVEKHFKWHLRSRNDKQRSNEEKEKEKEKNQKKQSQQSIHIDRTSTLYLPTPEYQTALAQSLRSWCVKIMSFSRGGLGLRPNTRLNSSIRGDMAQKPGHDGDCIWMKRMAALIRILRS